MSNTQIQLQLPEVRGKYQQVSVPRSAPGPNDISIRVKATALNPIDWKMHAIGIRVTSWPIVMGCDIAGVVEAVGESVKDFKVGDEVFSTRGPSNAGAGFQEVAVVPSQCAGKKPASMSFEVAASIPLGFGTAAAAIIFGLKTPLDFTGKPEGEAPKSILVLGGSSSVGAAAIQLLRLRSPSATIFTTSSAAHHAQLKRLGATECFDRSTPVDVIRKAGPGGNGVDAILDAVGGAAQQPSIFEVLNPAGPKLYSEVATGAEVKIPEGIKRELIIQSNLVEIEWSKHAMRELSELIGSGRYRVPIEVEVVGKGFDAIAPGLEKLKQGVSGKKLVVSL